MLFTGSHFEHQTFGKFEKEQQVQNLQFIKTKIKVGVCYTMTSLLLEFVKV